MNNRDLNTYRRALYNLSNDHPLTIPQIKILHIKNAVEYIERNGILQKTFSWQCVDQTKREENEYKLLGVTFTTKWKGGNAYAYEIKYN